MENKQIKEVVVVEGYHDLAKLKEIFPDIDVMITGGSEINQDTLNELRLLNKKQGLILFLDPDYPGERIRRIINEYVGDTKHAFLSKEKCISKSKKKVGIEHASKQDIVHALNHHLVAVKNNKNTITFHDLYSLDLLGVKDAKQRRKKLCDYTGIGLSNGKTLLKKLNMFNITKEQIMEALRS